MAKEGAQQARRSRRKRRPRSKRQSLQGRAIRASYAAAQTTRDNQRHWAAADSLSPNAAANPAVRKTVRERARLEIANDCYAKGIISTLANDVIGTGPRLQMLLVDAAGVALTTANQFIEREYARWTAEIGLPEKLLTMSTAKPVDGAAFAMLTANPVLSTPVLLDVRPFEDDLVTSPWPLPEKNELDGIRYDAAGNPTHYYVLRSHPGDVSQGVGGTFGQGDWVPASAVLHHFRVDRPGQRRGVSEIMPALPLFARRRRYALAVIGAAETAASFSGVLHTDQPASDATVEKAADLPEIELQPNLFVAIPDGYNLTQMKPEQPPTGYGEFQASIINEVGRCLDMPYNIAACNSRDYNYASGRLDHQTYFHSIKVRRALVTANVLDRIFFAWLAEARLVAGYLPVELRNPASPVPHIYVWDEREHVDPVKEAGRQKMELANGTTTKARECARRRADWEEEERQRDRERRMEVELNLRTQAWERDLRKELKLETPTPPGAPSDTGGDDTGDKADDEKGGGE